MLAVKMKLFFTLLSSHSSYETNNFLYLGMLGDLKII